ncbi:type I methionyl aminopeptidase [Salinithrix halophila]|uniref:Methionine aminopeptidase n=1 Tax=Salinithrix halophila TaxID=1485204 RepID=A0ABV8J9D4_9BACL
MIILKSSKELEHMRAAGRIVFEAHQRVKDAIRPGITTRELDRIAEDFITKSGATPSFKGYNGFKGSVCTSVNEELVHGIPGNRELQDGDIISVDIGACLKGYHGDSAWTYPVGTVSDTAIRLLEVTEESLYKGLNEAKPGNRIGDISHAVQAFVEKAGFSIVREYVGHGVGQDLHEEPSIPNYGLPGKGPRLKPGMTLAVEPMVNVGSRYVRTLADNWTVVTQDGSLCAHFEHTIAITDDGHEVLTTA